jgi:hypothetical protein
VRTDRTPNRLLSDQLGGPAPLTKVTSRNIEPLLARLDDLPSLTRLGKRTLERLRAAGKLPRPDLRIGRIPLWRIETIRERIDILSRDGGVP